MNKARKGLLSQQTKITHIMDAEKISLEEKKVKPVVDHLNDLLANYHIHYQKLRGCHWNVKGSNFFTLHIKFEELYTAALTTIDELAERILTLGKPPYSTFKDYITNMINGLIIMFSDRLSLGDHIKVHDTEGKILDITLINMILQNEDNDMVIIPNSVVFSSVIINQSKQNIKKLSIEFELALHFGYTPEYLESYLNKVVEGYHENIVARGLTIKTLSINKDMAIFKVQVLLNHYDKIKEREIRRALNTAILRLTTPVPEQPE